MRRSIDCYMTAETAEAIKLSGHRLHVVEPKKQFSIENWNIRSFPVRHYCQKYGGFLPGAVGYLIENNGDKLVFITDTFYSKYRFKGLNIIAIECNYSDRTLAPDIDPSVKKRLYKSHFNLERVLIFLRDNDLSKVRHIYLLHLSDGNSDAEMFKRKVMAATGIPTEVCGK